MSDTVNDRYFMDRAIQARGMAARALTPAARHIHLELAADYEQKSGRGAPAPFLLGDPV